MRSVGISFIVCGLLTTFVMAQESKPNFSGKWQVNAEKSQVPAGKITTFSVTIEQKGPSIHVIRTTKTNGKDSVVEFTCTTDGKDCDAKGVKVSLWYDGASLVEMDIGDNLVAKTIMTLGEGAKTISATVTSISPQAEPEKFVLDKM